MSPSLIPETSGVEVKTLGDRPAKVGAIGGRSQVYSVGVEGTVPEPEVRWGWHSRTDGSRSQGWEVGGVVGF